MCVDRRWICSFFLWEIWAIGHVLFLALGVGEISKLDLAASDFVLLERGKVKGTIISSSGEGN